MYQEFHPTLGDSLVNVCEGFYKNTELSRTLKSEGRRKSVSTSKEGGRGNWGANIHSEYSNPRKNGGDGDFDFADSYTSRNPPQRPIREAARKSREATRTLALQEAGERGPTNKRLLNDDGENRSGEAANRAMGLIKKSVERAESEDESTLLPRNSRKSTAASTALPIRPSVLAPEKNVTALPIRPSVLASARVPQKPFITPKALAKRFILDTTSSNNYTIVNHCARRGLSDLKDFCIKWKESSMGKPLESKVSEVYLGDEGEAAYEAHERGPSALLPQQLSLKEMLCKLGLKDKAPLFIINARVFKEFLKNATCSTVSPPSLFNTAVGHAPSDQGAVFPLKLELMAATKELFPLCLVAYDKTEQDLLYSLDDAGSQTQPFASAWSAVLKAVQDEVFSLVLSNKVEPKKAAKGVTKLKTCGSTIGSATENVEIENYEQSTKAIQIFADRESKRAEEQTTKSLTEFTAKILCDDRARRGESVPRSASMLFQRPTQTVPEASSLASSQGRTANIPCEGSGDDEETNERAMIIERARKDVARRKAERDRS